MARRPRHRQQSFVFEVTRRCNHECPHCYNAWKNPGDYAPDELPTDQTLAILDRMLDQTGARLVTVSGGEPLLRDDIFAIVDHLAKRAIAVNFLTNGSLMNDDAIARLAEGEKVSIFELPLLSVERAIHDEMSGRAGAFDDVTLAIASLKAARQRVVTVFVATKQNLHTWKRTAELAIALGADGIMFNRFNPGGQGRANVEALQAAPAELSAALDEAQAITEQYKLPISCSIAMPPCLFDHDRWPGLGFGFCAAGTERAYYTLDPVGNVRPCNHSTLILGNIGEVDFADMVESADMQDFKTARPTICSGCSVEETCLGGCKAAAEVCCGSTREADPFLAAFAADRNPALFPSS